MKCFHCNHQQEQNFSFCPQCGAPAQPVAPPPVATPLITENPVAKKLLCVFQDGLFLTLCILFSIYFGIGLLCGNFSVIELLTLIFLWIIYGQSRKEIADANHLRTISGIVFAQYIIVYVLAGVLLLLGGILAACFGLIADNYGLFMSQMPPEIMRMENFEDILEVLAGFGSIIFLVVFLLCAALFAVINLFSFRYIHGFTKSLYRSLQKQVLELKYVTATQVVLFVFGALSGLSALSQILVPDTFLDGLSGGIDCAVSIIAGLLIRKYFIENADEYEEEDDEDEE